jgi:hypothetical protein
MAWTSAYDSLDQYFIVEFLNRVKICSISTQGRSSTLEFIEEYCIQYSDNGKGWKNVEDSHGNIEV